MCAVCGILVMALPIPIVVDNFADYYQEQKKLEAAEIKAEAQAVEDEWRAEQKESAMRGLMETITRTELAPPCPSAGKNRTTNNGELIFGVDTVSYGQEHINRNGGKSK